VEEKKETPLESDIVVEEIKETPLESNIVVEESHIEVEPKDVIIEPDVPTNVENVIYYHHEDDDDIYEDLVDTGVDAMQASPSSDAHEIFSSAESIVPVESTNSPITAPSPAIPQLPEDEIMDHPNDQIKDNELNEAAPVLDEAKLDEPAIIIEEEQMEPPSAVESNAMDSTQLIQPEEDVSSIVPMAMEEDDDYNDIDFIDEDEESEFAAGEEPMERPFSADLFERHIQHQDIMEEDFPHPSTKDAIIAPAVHIISTRLSQIMSKEAGSNLKSNTISSETVVLAPFEVIH